MSESWSPPPSDDNDMLVMSVARERAIQCANEAHATLDAVISNAHAAPLLYQRAQAYALTSLAFAILIK